MTSLGRLAIPCKVVSMLKAAAKLSQAAREPECDDDARLEERVKQLAIRKPSASEKP